MSTSLLKNSLMLYLRMFISMIIGLYTSRLILIYLGAEDYGIYNVVGGIVSILGVLNTIMVTSTNRFIAVELGRGNLSKVSEVFSMSIVLHVAISLLTIILSLTIGKYYILNFLNVNPDKIQDALFVFYMSLTTTVFSFISVPYIALLNSYEKFNILALIGVIQSICNLLIALLLSTNVGSQLRLYATLISILYLCILIFYMLYKSLYHNEIKIKIIKSVSRYKEILSFSSWIAFGAVAHIGRNQGSSLILNSFFGTVLNASFGIANQVNIHLNQFAQNISRVFIPKITKSYSSGNYSEAFSLTFRSCKLTYLVLYLISLPILLKSNYIFNLWLKNPPEYVILFSQLMIIESLIINLNINIGTLVFANGQIKQYQFFTNIISLLNLPIAIVLFKLGMPPYGIVIGSAISILLSVILRQYLANKIVGHSIKEFILSVYIPCFLTTIMTLPLYLISSQVTDRLLNVAIFLIISVFIYLVIIYLVGLTKIEREYIDKYIINYKTKFFS